MRDEEYVERAIAILRHNPTAADLDFLIQSFAVVGNLAAEAEGAAERASFARKHAEANAYLKAKRQVPRPTDSEAKALAIMDTAVEHGQEAEAFANAKKLRNLLEAVEQAINAQKFLGRVDSYGR